MRRCPTQSPTAMVFPSSGTSSESGECSMASPAGAYASCTLTNRRRHCSGDANRDISATASRLHRIRRQWDEACYRQQKWRRCPVLAGASKVERLQCMRRCPGSSVPCQRMLPLFNPRGVHLRPAASDVRTRLNSDCCGRCSLEGQCHTHSPEVSFDVQSLEVCGSYNFLRFLLLRHACTYSAAENYLNKFNSVCLVMYDKMHLVVICSEVP